MIILALVLLIGGLVIGGCGIALLNCGISDEVKSGRKKWGWHLFAYLSVLLGTLASCVGLVLGAGLMMIEAKGERDHEVRCESMQDAVYTASSDTCYRNGEDISPWR